MPSSSHKPVRRVKSGGVVCTCEGWTYALIEEDPNQVKWYRPPHAKEQLGNRPALMEYWKQRRDRMPGFLNFRVKDAPEWLVRVDDEEEENAKSTSCGRSRDSTKKGRSRDVGSSKSPHSRLAVTSPARTTKVSTQPFPVSSPSSSTTMALTPASCNRGERRGAAAPETRAEISKGAAASEQPPAGAPGQQGDPRGREQGGATRMESGWPSQRRAEAKGKKDLAPLPEPSAMSNTPLPLSRSGVDEHDEGLRCQGRWQQGRGRQQPPEPPTIVGLDMVSFIQWIELELNFRLQGKNRWVDPNTYEVKSLPELEQMVKSNPQLMRRYQAWIECHSESDAVSPPRLSGEKGGFPPALSSTFTPGAVYPRQIDSGMGREDGHESVGSSTVTEEKEEDSDDDLDCTQMDPGVVSATVAENEENRATGNDCFDIDDDASDPQRGDGVPIDEYAFVGEGGGVQGNAVDGLGGGGADREDGPSSGEDGSVGREDAVAMDVVTSDDESSESEWVGAEDTYDNYESGSDGETRTGSPVRRKDSQEDLASNSSGEKKEGDERNNDGEDGTQIESRSAGKRSPAATPDRDEQRQSVEGQDMGGCDGEGDVSSDVICRGDGDSDIGGNKSDHHATSQKRMTRGARSVLSRGPKPSVPRLQHIWDFLRTEKNWNYVMVKGDHMVAGSDKDSGPMPQSQLRDFISEQPDLLRECNNWVGENVQDEERGRNSTSGPAPTRSRSRRRSVEPDQGLPEAKYAWEFVRENKGWGYHKGGIRIVGPEPEDLPIEYADLPRHIFTNPVLRREYNKWRLDLQRADDVAKREQEIKKERVREKKRRASEQKKLKVARASEGGSVEEEANDESNEVSNSESMDKEERRTLLMQNLRLENVDRKDLWKFLKQEEDWTYRAGGLESAHIYFKKGTPRDAEVGVHIFRSLDEVRHMVQQDPDLLKRFHEYYEEDNPAGSIKPTGIRKRSHSCGDSGADRDAATPSRKEKAARASASVGGDEPAMSSSSSRYARRTTAGKEGLGEEGNPDKDSVPMPQSQLRNFISEQPELLRECNDWVGKKVQDEERGRNSTSGPAPTRSSSRRHSVELDQGLPEAKYAWAFVRKNKEWDYHKDGICIVGPEPEDLPIEFADLPRHISTNPVLWREYNKWRLDLQRADDVAKREQEEIKKERVREREKKRRASEQKKLKVARAPEGGSVEEEAKDESNEVGDSKGGSVEEEANDESNEVSDSESMDEEERRTLLMQNLRLENVDRMYLWKFLKQEGWTYKAGRLESAFIYFKKGTPRDAEIGVHIFRSLDEVRHMVQQDPDLRKRFYEYYEEDIPAGSIKPTGTRKRSHSCGDSGADSDAATPSRKEKAARASASVGGGEPAMSSSPSRYARHTTAGEEGLGEQGNKLSQQQQKLKKGAKAAVIAVPVAARVSKTAAAGVSKERGPGSDGGKRKVIGSKGRAKPSHAAARSKRVDGDDGGDGCCETEFIEPPEIPGPKGGTCGVCLGPGSAKGSDLFLQCREHRCSSRVHKSCYPVDLKSIQDEFFRCNACAVNAAEPERRGCAICRREQGMGGYAMIPTKGGQFVHYLCFKKAVRGAENHQSFDKITRKFLAPDGVPQALALATRRKLKPCRVCRRPGGVLRSCFRKDCKIRFHPLCGAVRVVEVLNAGGEETGFGAEMAILCETHVEQADKDCSACGEPGTVGNMAACCRCDTHYHKACLDSSVEPDEETQGVTAKVDWVCANCKSACASSMLSESDGDDSDDGDDGDGAELEQENDETKQPRDGPGRRHQKQTTNKVKGKGKAISPAVPKKLASKHANGSSKKGKRDEVQRTKVKATKGGGGESTKKIAAERRRALEAMWSSCEEDDYEFGTSDGEGNSDDGMGAAAYAYPDKPRTEAFSAIPVGAQAYFNSHAGVKTLAVIPSGGGVAVTAGIGEGKGKGKTTRVMVGRKRGWHARNRYSRAAKEDRLSEEKEGRKRARRDEELVGDGSGGKEEDCEEAGGIAEAGGFYGGAGEASMKELLRLTQEPVRDQLDALMSKHAHSLPRWKSEMDWGWSPLFYGVGSKRELLQQLEDHVDQQGAAGGTVVGYDGFSANATVRGLLDSLCEEVLFCKSQQLSSASLRAYASNFAKAFASQLRRSVSRVATAEVAAPIVGCGGTRQGVHAHAGGSLGRRSSLASGKAAWDEVDRFFEVGKRAVPGRLFIFVHNIDGEKLRNEESQAALAELAASPVIHLAASIDHVNAPLMWDVALAEKFNWAWHKTHTYQPYFEELRNRRAWCAEEDEVLAMDRLSMVMKALTPRHVDVVVCLAKKLKGSPELDGKWVYKDLLAKLKSNLSADTSQILDGLLVELTDHNVLVDEKSGNSRYLSIPGGPEVLDYLAEYQR